jgi:membrane-associated phospholipid phosphatase
MNGFDGSARSALRIQNDEFRRIAQDASDLLLSISINQAAVDALLVAWWWRGSGDVAWELAMMDIEAFTFDAALNGLVAGFTSRERPYRDKCAAPDERDSNCTGNRRYRSFFSGHTSTSFTAAGLICSQHAHIPLYGGGTADTLACAASFTVATAVGALRVVSDQHFVTDVLTGAAIGTLTGFGLPWFLHFRGTRREVGRAPSTGVSMRLVPAPLGGHVVGTF